MRVNLYGDDKGRWHWKIFKIIGQEGQVKTNVLLKSAVMSLIWKRAALDLTTLWRPRMKGLDI